MCAKQRRGPHEPIRRPLRARNRSRRERHCARHSALRVQRRDIRDSDDEGVSIRRVESVFLCDSHRQAARAGARGMSAKMVFIATHFRDRTRMRNYWAAAITEMVALSPKRPYITKTKNGRTKRRRKA